MPTRWKFILQYKQVTCIGGWVSTFKIFLRPSNSGKKWRSKKQKEIDVQNILRTRDGFLLLKRTVLYNYYLRIHSRILSITYETFLVNISNRNRSETDRFQSHILCVGLVPFWVFVRKEIHQKLHIHLGCLWKWISEVVDEFDQSKFNKLLQSFG